MPCEHLLVGFHDLVRIAGRAVQGGQPVAVPIVVRVQFLGLFKVGDGAFLLALASLRQAQVVPGRIVVGVLCQDGAEQRFRLVVLAVIIVLDSIQQPVFEMFPRLAPGRGDGQQKQQDGQKLSDVFHTGGIVLQK